MLDDLENLKYGFEHSKRLGLIIRNENVNPIYTISFMCALLEEESNDLFEVRQAILGHLQQGGHPTPFDRIMATRMAKHCVDYLIQESDRGTNGASFIGLKDGHTEFFSLEDYPRMMDQQYERAKSPWWMSMNDIVKVFALAEPSLSIVKEQ